MADGSAHTCLTKRSVDLAAPSSAQVENTPFLNLVECLRRVPPRFVESKDEPSAVTPPNVRFKSFEDIPGADSRE